MNHGFVTARSEATRQSMSEGIPAWIATAFGLAMTRGCSLAMTEGCGLAMTVERVHLSAWAEGSVRA